MPIDEVFKKLLSIMTEPVQITLLLFIAFLVKENWRIQKITDKLLKAQEDRGTVLTKITVMLEAMFNDSRRGK